MGYVLEWVQLIFIGVSVALLAKFIYNLQQTHKEDCKDMRSKIEKISERLIKLETKTDIFLDHSGISVKKTDRAIAEHIEDLKQNDRPTLGCINVKSLYKDPGE